MANPNVFRTWLRFTRIFTHLHLPSLALPDLLVRVRCWHPRPMSRRSCRPLWLFLVDPGTDVWHSPLKHVLGISADLWEMSMLWPSELFLICFRHPNKQHGQFFPTVFPGPLDGFLSWSKKYPRKFCRWKFMYAVPQRMVVEQKLFFFHPSRNFSQLTHVSKTSSKWRFPVFFE